MDRKPHSHGGHRQRIRERFMENGLNGFAAHEVLELILSFAIPRQDVNPLAHRLIDHFGSLHKVLEADVAQLQQVEGIGEYTAVLLTLFPAVEKRCEQSRQARKESLMNREAAEKHCVRLLKGCKEEHCYAVYLNGQMEVLADVLITRGSLSEVHSYPRVIADYALRYNAHAVILCHNHPGGSMTPSSADLASTRHLQQALEHLEIRLIDHIIVADRQAASIMRGELLQMLGGDPVAQNRVANSAGEVAMRRRLTQLKKSEMEDT